MSAYYELGRGAAPWGDYGDILWSGFTEERQEQGQKVILLSGTGPFVLPITLPFGRALVTDEFRQMLIAQRFSRLSFEPVGYGKVVHVAWEQWDLNAPEPPFYPETGEPEDYLLDGAHDEQLAATMPALWAWSVPRPDCKSKVATTSGENFIQALTWRGSTSSRESVSD